MTNTFAKIEKPAEIRFSRRRKLKRDRFFFRLGSGVVSVGSVASKLLISVTCAGSVSVLTSVDILALRGSTRLWIKYTLKFKNVIAVKLESSKSIICYIQSFR